MWARDHPDLWRSLGGTCTRALSRAVSIAASVRAYATRRGGTSGPGAPSRRGAATDAPRVFVVFAGIGAH